MLHVAPVTRLSTWLLSGGILLSSASAQEEDTGALQIESATDELSADIHIAREEGKEPPRSEAEDKKRKNLGIGEFVTLSLTENLLSLETRKNWNGTLFPTRIPFISSESAKE